MVSQYVVGRRRRRHPKPLLSVSKDGSGIHADHPELGAYELQCEGTPVFLFTNNETNEERNGGKSVSRYTKDAFHRYLLQKETRAINPARTGTKAAAHYELKIPAGKSQTIRMRLTKVGDNEREGFVSDFSSVMQLATERGGRFLSTGSAAACLR